MAVGWGSKNAATQLTSVTTEQFFDDTPQLDPNQIAHIEIIADIEIEETPPPPPTDDLLVKVYGTLDASSENWDDTPILEFRIDKDSDPNKVSFRVSGVYKFRVGVQRDGSTDSYTVDMAHRIGTLS